MAINTDSVEFTRSLASIQPACSHTYIYVEYIPKGSNQPAAAAGMHAYATLVTQVLVEAVQYTGAALLQAWQERASKTFEQPKALVDKATGKHLNATAVALNRLPHAPKSLLRLDM